MRNRCNNLDESDFNTSSEPGEKISKLLQEFAYKASPSIAFVVLITVFHTGGAALAQSTRPWRMVWADEFDGSAGSSPDRTKWNYDIGNGGPFNLGWGNNERQNYTNSTRNVFLDGNGHLVIRVLRENGSYTSGRVKTQDKFSLVYGKVEARIRIPYAQGIWPAFWLLGANCRVVAWPTCGEVDIMENFGVQSGDGSRTHGALQGPGYAGTGITKTYELPNGRRFANDFHTFSIDWRPDSIEFFVDGNSYMEATPKSLPGGSLWVFNRAEFFMILNLAVGGYPAPVGYPDSTTTVPQEMVVDYVRVYQR